MNPDLVLIRLRLRGTDLWVGKGNVSGALVSASKPEAREGLPSRYIWVTERRAKAWTSLSAFRAAVTHAMRWSVRSDPAARERMMSNLEVVYMNDQTDPLGLVYEKASRGKKG